MVCCSLVCLNFSVRGPTRTCCQLGSARSSFEVLSSPMNVVVIAFAEVGAGSPVTGCNLDECVSSSVSVVGPLAIVGQRALCRR